jgi:hypothetical protein
MQQTDRSVGSEYPNDYRVGLSTVKSWLDSVKRKNLMRAIAKPTFLFAKPCSDATVVFLNSSCSGEPS